MLQDSPHSLTCLAFRPPRADWYKPRPGWARWMDKRIAFLGSGWSGSGRKMMRA